MAANKTPAQKRREQREALWPNSDSLLWTAKSAKGFFSAPRTISLVATLIRHLAPKLDPSRVYLDLWARNFEESIVDVGNEQDMAAACGYALGTRSIRTWRERIDALVKFGFIRVKPSGTRKHGHILLLHPDRVIATLRLRDDLTIPDWWLSLYDARMRDTGASVVTPIPDGAA
jgi:hypothetical protein